jgi:arylformamidase
MIYDISPPISAALPVWPGDTPPTRELLLDMRAGDSITLSTLRATVHLGAHADAPSHFSRAGASVESVPLESYIGPCQVVRAAVERGSRVTMRDIRQEIAAERVLVATGSCPDPNHFNPDFAALSTELVSFLHDQGVRLVGIDTPSVDLFESQDLPAHHACLERSMSILECLSLADVPEGVYELCALPLRLVGFDASPVRAILRTIDGASPRKVRSA